MSLTNNISIDNKEFTAMSTNEHVSSKRKKGVDYDWKQSNTDIDIIFNLESMGIDTKQARDLDVTFSNDDVTINFPDGRKWFCKFDHTVDGKSCKVFIRKHKAILRVKKKEAIVWQRLETLTNPSRPASSGIDLDSPSPTTPNDEGFMTLSQESLTSSSFENLTPMASAASTCLAMNSQEEQELDQRLDHQSDSKKEEPLYHLDHVKHDYIEKDSVFIVHVYVKEIKKDTVKVLFGEKMLVVQFQTLDQKFLQLHQDSNDETTFSWKVNLKHEIVASTSKFRVTGVLIEVTLSKQIPQKWGALEATLRKETITSAKSDSWISTRTSSHSSGDAAVSQPPLPEPKNKNVAFDELTDVNVSRKQELDMENQASAEMSLGATGISRDGYTQKPMCKVSPMNKNSMEQFVTPGFTGLDNLGNTCFMNSVLQSLVNTRELRDYFLDTRFQKDINQDNPLGSGGKLAVSYAVLLKVLWSGKHNSYAPSKLKNLIAMKASQFTGFAQHDAQEFMAFLLDGLHEDLNRVRKKPYTKTVDSDGRPDEVVADEAWQVYKKRNDSFIVDLFQGQYKSKLTCPVCGKISITFDPFLYLSVPLPKKKRLLPVIFFWKDPYKKPVQLMLRLPKESTTEMLKEAASKKTGVKPSAMRVLEAYRGKIYKIYGKGADLSSVQSIDTIIVSEVLTEDIAGEPVHEIYVIQRTLMPNQVPSHCAACRQPCLDGSKLKRCTRCYKVGYCDQNCQKHHWTSHKMHCKSTPEPVGSPFVLSIPESRATFSRLCSLMEAYARYSVHVFQPPLKTDNKNQLGNTSGSSDLGSNSSQSSGSMSSLDSQSSCSSSCTITADQDQAEDRVNFTIGDPAGTSSEEDSGPNSSPTGEKTQSSCSFSTQVGSTGEGSSISVDANQASSTSVSSTTNMPPCIIDSDVQLPGGDSPDPDFSFRIPEVDKADAAGHEDHEDGKSAPGNVTDSNSATSGSTKSTSKTVPTLPVLGIQSGDTERTVQMFFIKPVSQDGIGVRGPDGETLEDKGDEPLDLSYRQFFSIDWRNNEKMEQYVLVETKEMDYDEDPSRLSVTQDDNGNITLQHCLDLFTEPEVLSPEEAWYCPKCKEHREATKQMSIWRLPHTLIIQLKRFSFRNFIWRDKIDKMIDYPTRCLDLSPYVQNDSNGLSIYDLYAVVNHYGGILGGHYTSFVRCADPVDYWKNEVEWRLCDDHRVTKVGSEKNVVSKGAYLLFYRRREPFSPPKLLSDSQMEDSDTEESVKEVDSSQDQKRDSSDPKCTPKECFGEEKESCYEKEILNDDLKNANVNTPASHLIDNAASGVLPELIDHRYQRQSGIVENESSGLEAEYDSDSGHVDDSTYPTEDMEYTDMEAVD